MLAEILANPVAWPLWSVLAFAATMYPIGLLMPGCVCCGTSGCACGISSIGYVEGQNQYGRMCCDGTLAPSITVRATNTGPASSVYLSRSSPDYFGYYQKVTATFPCSSFAGDYVMPRSGCEWRTGGLGFAGGAVVPLSGTAFPDWYLYSALSSGTWSITRRVQTCTGYPGPESCNVGSTNTTTGQTFATPMPIESYSHPYSIRSETFNVQNCNPSGVLLADPATIAWWIGSASGAQEATGCLIRVEIV